MICLIFSSVNEYSIILAGLQLHSRQITVRKASKQRMKWRILKADLMQITVCFNAFYNTVSPRNKKEESAIALSPDTKIMFFEGDSKSYMKYIDINGGGKSFMYALFFLFWYVARKSQMVGYIHTSLAL